MAAVAGQSSPMLSVEWTDGAPPWPSQTRARSGCAAGTGAGARQSVWTHVVNRPTRRRPLSPVQVHTSTARSPVSPLFAPAASVSSFLTPHGVGAGGQGTIWVNVEAVGHLDLRMARGTGLRGDQVRDRARGPPGMVVVMLPRNRPTSSTSWNGGGGVRGSTVGRGSDAVNSSTPTASTPTMMAHGTR